MVTVDGAMSIDHTIVESFDRRKVACESDVMNVDPGARLTQAHKALSSPLRLRMMELLWVRPRSARELAPLVGMPTDRLYHHLKLLLDAGLVEIRDYRPLPGGKVERVYAATMMEPPGEDVTPEELSRFLTMVLETTRADLEAAFLAKAAGERREVHVTRTAARLSLDALRMLREAFENAVRDAGQGAGNGAGNGPYVRILWTFIDAEDRDGEI